MKIKKVNILGTTYTMYLETTTEEEPRLKRMDGFLDFSTKEIYIQKFEPDEDSIKDLKSYEKQVIRHEIIHGYVFESGLKGNSLGVDAWANNEEMTDFFAIQFPK